MTSPSEVAMKAEPRSPRLFRVRKLEISPISMSTPNTAATCPSVPRTGDAKVMPGLREVKKI